MVSGPIESEWGIESPLIDLGTMPLRSLLTRHDAALGRAMRHVVEQAGSVQVNESDGTPSASTDRVERSRAGYLRPPFA